MTIRLVPTALPGVVVVESTIYRDDRGFLVEAFNTRDLGAVGLPTQFLQGNRSRSTRGVLRGLHLQRANAQGKLVTAVTGEIFDVAVDVRVGSPTYGQWTGMHLHGDAPRSLWIPAGFAHGFCVLSDVADIFYAATALYDPQDELGVRWSDPAISIAWPIERPLLSPRDAALPSLAEIADRLPRFEP
jgi:dTDP-4-dehydrorhamnose 3,5-epimerase